ncbi:MAG: trypsin-like peptidase domain-containing protein [bacterium]
MFCKNCGKEIKVDVKFCNNCGQEIKVSRIPVLFSGFLAWIKKYRKMLLIIFSIIIVIVIINNLSLSGSNDSSNINETEDPVQAVVNVVCDSEGGGSGTIFEENGVIITNNHVLSGSNSCFITLPDTNGFPAKIYRAKPITVPELSEKYDIAILVVNGSFTDKDGKTWGDFPSNFPSFSSPDKCSNIYPKLGDKITIYGYPVTSGGINLTITDGIISSFSDDGFILTSAKIDSGNSGGLAIDQNGCFVGIPSAIAEGNYQNLGVIIPREIVLDFFSEAEPSLSQIDFFTIEQDNFIDSSNMMVCDFGLIESDVSGRCISLDQYCKEKNGTHWVQNAYDNTCECAQGYSYSTWSNDCVSYSTLCSENYINSIWDGSYCDCPNGYTWNFTQTACISNNAGCAEKWPNTYFSGFDSDGKKICDCIAGYSWNPTKNFCRSHNETCKLTYGSNSVWSGDVDYNGSPLCSCIIGSGWNDTKDSCIPNSNLPRCTADSWSCTDWSQCPEDNGLQQNQWRTCSKIYNCERGFEPETGKLCPPPK